MINIILRLLGRMLFDCSDSTQFPQQELMQVDSIREVGTDVIGLPELRQE